MNYGGYDLVQALTEKLNDKTGSHIFQGGYEGWVKFMFDMDGSQRQSINMFYTHGAGGAAPVTKGVIKTARRAVYLPDADVIVSGHSHNAWDLWTGRLRLSRLGVQSEDKQLHIQTPGYKGRGDFEIRNEHPPKPCGAYWLNFRRQSHRIIYRAIWV
ncbi:unnamed protein product [marine sediment metagenome]|uniref:Calcineurin-like phosphoesterase domain-containing protein n=1 Tax=marine sediment metagenome TaxID=412755 RepID=X0UH99_9ZZZZ